MSRRITLSLVVFLIIISSNNLSSISGNQLPEKEAPVLNQSFQTAISKVDLVINTYLMIARMNLTIEYIQIEENATKFIDTVSIKGNASDVSVIDSQSNELLITSEYNETLDETSITFQLQRALNLGEKYSALVFGLIPTTTLFQNRMLDFSVNWTQTVSVFSAIVYLEKYLVLLSTTPPPQTTSVIDQRIKMTWDTIMLDDFNLVVEFKASLAYEVISVSPTVWNIGNITRSRTTLKQKFTIQNLVNSYVRVDIVTNDSRLDIVDFIILNPLAQKEIIAELDISQEGSFAGDISFSTNMSLLEITCEVSVYVEKGSNPWTIVGLVLGIAFLILGGFAFYMYRQLKPVEQVIEDKKTQEQIKGMNIEKLKGFLNENEMLVIKEVIEHPGISQAQIVRNTEISKATLSRIVAKMERKGLIYKKSVGMSHQLYLDKDSSFFRYAKK